MRYLATPSLLFHFRDVNFDRETAKRLKAQFNISDFSCKKREISDVPTKFPQKESYL